MRVAFFLFFLFLLIFVQQALASPGYYRYPALHNDTLVFHAEGDLWKIKLGEHYAQRLTTHPSEEKESSISPDGNWVAFAANYSDTRGLRDPHSSRLSQRYHF